MKKYYVVYTDNFANTYNLYWTDSAEMEKMLPDGAEQISRKEAIALAAREKRARKENPNFSGYASDTIYPADYDDAKAPFIDRYYTLVDGYILEKND